MRELHAELLKGRRIVDRNGKKVGHIQEIVAEVRGTELIVREVHVGRSGFAERFSLRRMHDKKPAKIRWEDIDFTDPERPRLKITIDEL